MIIVRFRVLCYKLSSSSAFGNIILVCIMLSSAMLAAEDPLDATQKGFRNWVSIFVFIIKLPVYSLYSSFNFSIYIYFYLANCFIFSKNLFLYSGVFGRYVCVTPLTVNSFLLLCVFQARVIVDSII